MYLYITSKVPEKDLFSTFKVIWDKISWLGLVHNREMSSVRYLIVFEGKYCKIKLIEYKSRFCTGSNVFSEQLSLILVDPGEITGNLMLSSGKYIVEKWFKNYW